MSNPSAKPCDPQWDGIHCQWCLQPAQDKAWHADGAYTVCAKCCTGCAACIRVARVPVTPAAAPAAAQARISEAKPFSQRDIDMSLTPQNPAAASSSSSAPSAAQLRAEREAMELNVATQRSLLEFSKPSVMPQVTMPIWVNQQVRDGHERAHFTQVLEAFNTVLRRVDAMEAALNKRLDAIEAAARGPEINPGVVALAGQGAFASPESAIGHSVTMILPVGWRKTQEGRANCDLQVQQIPGAMRVCMKQFGYDPSKCHLTISTTADASVGYEITRYVLYCVNVPTSIPWNYWLNEMAQAPAASS